MLLGSLKPTILTLSKTWLTEGTESSLLIIPGYELIRSDRTIIGRNGKIKTGGGLATYIATSCRSDPHKYANLSCCNDDVEMQVISVSKGQDKGAIIINTYRPPSGNPQVFLDYISHVVGEVSMERYRDIYLVGDLNLDHTEGRSHEQTRNLISIMKMHGFSQLIKKPTRMTIHTQSLLDIIYIRSKKKTTPLILATSISDHFLVGCIRYLDYAPDPTTSFYGRTYRCYSYESALEFYETIDRTIIYQLEDVDMVWDILKGFILKCANHLCPMRKITTKVNQPGWISTYLLELINDRDTRFIEAYQTKDPATLTQARVLRTEVRRVIRNSRADYISSQLNDSRNNPRKFWGEINSLLNRRKQKIRSHSMIRIISLSVPLIYPVM